VLFWSKFSSDKATGSFSSTLDMRFEAYGSAKSPYLDSNSSSRLFSSAELCFPFFCAVLESKRLS